ncbi:alanine/glycine:cation symporter family protein [Tessaracoccus flavus]|uniref:Sodium:alanine symporter family protein n=1 Tax=Tessaracoccus flavus TaxID=1610493 RepID=A0A1Q2CI50_9ACTN|nr:alanine/glycine:cation symporter family protein [Tessaracoccus flavus]AQP45792.1 sodium:alanine symporter family protein [Tessaracoccus flavus]SDZ20747.1 alanine or glycine:cation symporter, AGCS family [Tessaracoccus flavus]
METITNWLDGFNGQIYSWILIPVLLGAGVWFTVATRGMQFRLIGRMFSVLGGSRHSADKDGGISSFQAFAIGLASRVGTGNIAGVAIAITLGGPGAVFWMWVVALLGMATAFIEATLAQIFKMPWGDGTFRGGPAFYIWRGLKSWKWGAVFAVVLLFTYGIAFQMVQANTIATTVQSTFGVDTWITALIIAALTGAAIIGGIRSVAKVSEVLAPAMALIYVLIALVVIALNLDQIGFVFSEIIQSAFGLNEAFAGTAGGITAAIMNGVKRGLYSNEAGMGSAPNAASTATTIHPARQGLIQSFGVFVDTMIVCSATAFIVLSSGVYTPGQDLEGATLTQSGVAAALGDWMAPVMVVLISVFAFSTLIGNYAYAEVNLDYLTKDRPGSDLTLKIVVVIATFVGGIAKLSSVWVLADTSMFFMAIINLVAIILLGKWAFAALRDYEANPEGRFVAVGNDHLPGVLDTEIWVADPPKAAVR